MDIGNEVYGKILTGNIVANENGYKALTLHKIFGEIVKIKAIYGKDCAENTNLIFTTSEGEKINYHDNKDNFIDYPRNAIHMEKFKDTGAENFERFVNVGDLLIELENAGPGAIIQEICIVWKKK